MASGFKQVFCVMFCFFLFYFKVLGFCLLFTLKKILTKAPQQIENMPITYLKENNSFFKGE